MMKIQINTDRNIDGNERLQGYFDSKITAAFSRFERHITSIIIHLSDENAGKSGPDDKRCALEVRADSINPHTVSASADTLDKAVDGAIAKMKRVLETEFGKLNEVR
ncbi:HPF/RaiA family ribosome-associated protein [Pedobacter sp. JY14-1]|uniref:HPF/RaiA family ribosome-associated protein n=1 Tax=Pedobacter sp. JY14-1 TaxID=3034151 RepID=UPI0023E18B4F|nr:HPF/RaiA family ribosome-associated protein [Pedobacter sp. JY14-1]